jgi:UDP-N-acetyl-D-glucosamine dehydrogenase
VADALNDERKAINGSRILLLGVAYKPNVGDVRESPALDIIHLLQTRGALVSYHDPYVADLSHEGLPLRSIELAETAVQQADCVVVVTHHDSYDWPWLAGLARLVVDTRNVMKGISGGGRIVRL